MKKSINAIIVMYNGAPVGTNEVAVSMIASALAQSGLVEDYDDITIVAKDTEALTQAAIRECTSDKPDVKIINLKKKDEDQLMEGAIIFLGTLFKESLKEGKETRNYGSFMKDLLINSHDEKVRRAIEVIATKQGSVSKGLFSEYYMTKGAIETIRDAHGTIV